MGNIEALLHIALSKFFGLLEWLILIRIILSWLPIGRNPVTDILYTLTEPILGPVRSMMDKSPLGGGMMIDFSPVIALFVLRLVHMLLDGLVGLF